MENEREQAPQPSAPGYGDQGPAGAGRDPSEREEATKTEKEPGPVNDLGG